MSGISAYLLSIVGVVILLVIIDLILPDSKISKYIKSIAAVFVVAVIASPIVKLVNSNWDWHSLFVGSEYQIDENILNNINQQNIEILEDEITNYLTEQGFEGVEVMVSANFTENELKISYIYVNLCDLVINENLEHIDYYTKIKELITQQINIEGDKIIIYG